MKDRDTRNIGLIGFMATGKTAVGSVLATKLQVEFLDTDSVIEERAGKPISEIFSEDGEAAFRRLETKVVQEVCQINPAVISFGGGVVLSPDNVETIRNSTTVVLLTASIDTILSRIMSSDSRPLLRNNDEIREERINNLLAQREVYYRTAMDFMIHTDGKLVTEIVEELLRRLQQ